MTAGWRGVGVAAGTKVGLDGGLERPLLAAVMSLVWQARIILRPGACSCVWCETARMTRGSAWACDVRGGPDTALQIREIPVVCTEGALLLPARRKRMRQIEGLG